MANHITDARKDESQPVVKKIQTKSKQDGEVYNEQKNVMANDNPQPAINKNKPKFEINESKFKKEIIN